MDPVAAQSDDYERRPEPPPPIAEFRSGPLVPIVVAVTAGICIDRYLGDFYPAKLNLVVAVLGALAWLAWRRNPTLAKYGLWLGFAGAGMLYHHSYWHVFPPDDIGRTIQPDKPSIVKLRAIIVDEFTTRKTSSADGPSYLVNKRFDQTQVDVVAMNNGDWQPASGRIRLTVDSHEDTKTISGLKVGDVVEIVGKLSTPHGPSNPGERDTRKRLLDQRIRGDLRADVAGVSRVDTGEYPLLRGLSSLRGYGTSVLTSQISEVRSPVARALLLGDGTAMDRSEWDAYVRTGVVHVLAISGQHLVLLASFLWLILNLFNASRRQVAVAIIAIICIYATLTGLRPSALRAAVMVSLVCGAVLLRRPVHRANTFSVAWLMVAILNPADLFDLGCRLSFVSVFVLIWGIGPAMRTAKPPPIQQLIDESRSVFVRWFRRIGHVVMVAYAVNAVLFVTNTPLLIAEQNVASPIGLVVGPPLILLTSIALIAGFALLIVAPIPGLADVLGSVTQVSLDLCQWLVHLADRVPGGTLYLPGLPYWWVVGFYLILIGVILYRVPGLKIVGILTVWILIVMIVPTHDRPEGELRVAILSVGHGSCTVIETPDGRCILYDTGSSFGTDATRRVIAPYLWHRGIRRIDEIFISHADADHFNGLPELLRRFSVGRITLTPSFAEKPTNEVAQALLAIHKYAIPTRLATEGLKSQAGEVSVEVLHPPASGPDGSENVRSMVLLIEHAGHRILLTGDLEEAGMSRVLSRPATHVDILQAPHHGSQKAFPKSLVQWCTPRFVVVSRGTIYTNNITEAHVGNAIPVWDTPTHGTITIRSHASGLSVHSYREGKIEAVRR